MAYANSIMFYGWLGDDALHTIKFLLPNENYTSIKLIMKNNKIDEKLNNKINDNNIAIKIGTFRGGSNSEESKLYLSIGKVLESTSCDDSDICDTSYSLEEIKNFMNMSFSIRGMTNSKYKPKLYNLVVTDTK